MFGDFHTPDICKIVRAVARYCSAPISIHWKAGLGILAYINGTSGFGIISQRGTTAGFSLEVLADADYASKATDKGSVSGGAIMCGAACVFWFSRAEYVALGDAVKESLFLRQVWRLMLPDKDMHEGAVQLSQNPSPNSNSELINVRHHLFRELVCQGGFSVNHVPSEYQHAEILTKY